MQYWLQIFPPQKDIDNFWILYFNGAKSQEGMGEIIVLISPRHDHHYFSFQLEFDGTNNFTEYEALFLGINVTKDYGI